MHEYFRILGVTDSVTPEELKKAWKKKCFENHPDRGGNEEEFKKIMHAYKMITDPSYRHLEKSGRPNIDEALLLRIKCPISFEDAFFGRKVVISYNQLELDAKLEPVVKQEQRLCVLSITLPAGSVAGFQHIAPGKGLYMGEKFGDCVVNFSPNQHNRYRVQGLDVFVQERVPLETMLKGGSMQVETLFGLKTLKIPPGTQPGAKLRIKKCGVMEKGSQYVEVMPIFPNEAELKTKTTWKDLKIDWATTQPEEEYDAEEQEMLRKFVQMGGRVFKAEGSGEA